jgi:hypothetical protein
VNTAAVILGSTPDKGVSPSCADRAAIGLAQRHFGSRVDAYCAARGSETARYALAAGIAEVQWIGALEDISASRCGYRLILCGTLTEEYGDLLAATFAELMNCVLIYDALDIHPLAEGFRVVRDLERGNTEQLIVQGRLVCSLAPTVTWSGYVSRFRRHLSNAKLATHLAMMPPSVPRDHHADWAPIRPRPPSLNSIDSQCIANDRMSRAFGLSPDVGEDSRQRVVLEGSKACATHLVRYLVHYGFLNCTPGIAESDVDQPTVTTTAATANGTGVGKSLPLVGRHARMPKPLTGTPRGIHRSPRPAVLPTSALPTGNSKHLRRPRPLVDKRVSHMRGPFALVAPVVLSPHDY